MENDFEPFRAIVRRLTPLIHNNRSYWTEAINRWADDPPHHDDLGVLPIPLPVKLSRDERITLLAAIYDACVTAAARINPWRDPNDLPDLSDESLDAIPGEYVLANRYAILTNVRVPLLRQHWDTHQAAIELFISETECELDEISERSERAESERRDAESSTADLSTATRHVPHPTGTFSPHAAVAMYGGSVPDNWTTVPPDSICTEPAIASAPNVPAVETHDPIAAGGRTETEPSRDGTAVSVNSPISNAPTGLLGGSELATALGVHPTRQDAFLKKVERERISLGNDWQEVREPRPNSPRFLYRVDSPKLIEIAGAYQNPKPA